MWAVLLLVVIGTVLYINFTSLYFWIESKKKRVLITLFLLSFISGFFIYFNYYLLPWYEAAYYALTQFTGDVKLPVEIGLDLNSKIISHEEAVRLDKHFYLIYISAALAMLTSFLTILLVFMKKNVRTWHAVRIATGSDYLLVIGLTENNTTFILNELKSHKKIIAIEKNPDNPNINYLEEQGVGVLTGRIEEYLSLISKKFPKAIIISVGNDRHNIDIATILENEFVKLEEKNRNIAASTFYIHLENQNFEALYQQRILSLKRTDKLDFRPYSFYDDVARELCMKHSVLGNYVYEPSLRSKEYTIVLVGCGKLAERLLYHLCMLVQLPGNERFHIVCAGKEADDFLARARASFLYIDQIDNVVLGTLNSAPDSVSFYTSSVWQKEYLTNVILCDDDENSNFKNAVDLYDKVFLKKSKDETFATKILIALFHNLDLGEIINQNREEFKNFYVFGAIEKICTREHLINETHETLAKLIHYGYGDIYDKDNEKIKTYLQSKKVIHEEIEKKWRENTRYSDRESNRSQALHIDTKLLALNLVKTKSSSGTDPMKLLEWNMKIFGEEADMDTFFKDFPKDEIVTFSKQLVAHYRGEWVDEAFVNDFFERLMKSEHIVVQLMKSEHKRWNAFHYLNGWKYSSTKNKELKEHHCLIDMELFDSVFLRMLVIYDLYAVLYIPSYLAGVNYKIEKKHITIGVTGHRDIKKYGNALAERLKYTLMPIVEEYNQITLCSPLAEGADRLFVNEIASLGRKKIKKLIVPMPFSRERYSEDFKTKESKTSFLSYLTGDHPSLDSKVEVEYFCVIGTENESHYLEVGKYVVDHSDLIVAIWDGHEAKGPGGTGDIVHYAQNRGKKIIYIDL